ncbi:GNAT family N-acetyltransferase [Acinetobacter sp. WCHAc060025]|uniref:GNAT family N-acetyltransferase n=1 Tax=Acinetobacter sp. WCHAc060025 TaxID=2518625 RepID=UPI0010238C4D|nr:GNAT family N-acetyltransferase [Acinetobacter sp. WCHAc060025]RZG74094.1 N-acetyltransferase [Acinetobacter sp. WCHAc060025]
MDHEKIVIQSSRITLKPFTAHDADESYVCITPTLTRFMSWEPPENRQVYDGIWQGWIQHIAEGSEYVFVIRHTESEEFLGLGGFHDVHSRTPELGIWIREDRHGAGYGKEAVTAIANWASANFDFEHFIYPVAIENHVSCRIAESLNGIAMYCTQKPKYKAVTYFIAKNKQD